MPTAEFPSWALSNSPFYFHWMNRASYSLIFWALWKQESGRINTWRKHSLGLPPLQHGSAGVLAACPDIPVITMCSRHVIPGLKVPADWGSNVHVTGFAFPAATPEEVVDPKLRTFVEGSIAGSSSSCIGSSGTSGNTTTAADAGAVTAAEAAGSPGSSTGQCGSSSKPLYLGFGSMPAPDPKALLQLAVEVVQQTGRRTVLVAGWSELDGLLGGGEGRVEVPEGLMVVPHAPHDWLLPR
jgi:hypothetical protein